MSKITIIIVNWNTGRYLARCIESLTDLPPEEKDIIDEVIVVDNNSRDNSVIKAKDIVGRNINRPRVRFINNEKNLGFAAANNIGIDRVLAKNEANNHVLLLNPDTEVKTGMLKELIKPLEQDNNIGIVGAKLIGGDGQLQPSVRRFPTNRDMILFMLKLGRFVRQSPFDYNTAQEVDQVMGAAFLIRNQLLNTIKKLDEEYFVWFEEVDYCQRAKKAGWKVWYTPEAQCVHYGGISFGQLIGFKKTIPWLKSMLHYAKKHMSKKTLYLLYALSLANIILTIPATLFHFKKNK